MIMQKKISFFSRKAVEKCGFDYDKASLKNIIVYVYSSRSED